MSDPIKPPSGFVTFVFTDIEDSTTMCAALGNDIYAKDVHARHCELIRQLATRHNGYEFNTKGDSFQIAFEFAADAILFAVEMQQGLEAAPIQQRGWTVRIRVESRYGDILKIIE